MKKCIGHLIGGGVIFASMVMTSPSLFNKPSAKHAGCERPSYEDVKNEADRTYRGIIQTLSKEDLSNEDLLSLKRDLLVSYGDWYDGIRTATSEPRIDKKRFKRYSALAVNLKRSFERLDLLLNAENAPEEEISNLRYFSGKLDYIMQTGLLPQRKEFKQ